MQQSPQKNEHWQHVDELPPKRLSTRTLGTSSAVRPRKLGKAPRLTSSTCSNRRRWTCENICQLELYFRCAVSPTSHQPLQNTRQSVQCLP